MHRKVVLALSGLIMSAFFITAVSACSSNQSSKELDSKPTEKTESTSHSKKVKKNTSKKDNNDSESSKDESDTPTSNNTQATNTKSPKNNYSNQSKRQTASTSKTPNAANNATSGNVRSPARITNADDAASLVAHSFGSYSHSAMNVTKENDGYHVSFETGGNNSPVTVVKPNGDFYDTNGNLMNTYSQVAAPNGAIDSQWYPQ